MAEKAPVLFAAMKAQEALWFDAEEIGKLKQVTARGVRRRLDLLLGSTNGTRARYERETLSKSGGGTGGRKRQFNLAALAESFPEFIAAELLEAARKDSEHSATLQLFDSATPAEITVTNEAILEKHSTPSLPFEKPEVLEAIRAIENPRQAAWAQARASVIEPLRSWQAWKGQTVHGFHIQRLGDLVNALAKDSAVKHSALIDWAAISAELRRTLDDHDAAIAPLSAGTLWRWWTWYAKGRVGNSGRKTFGIEALADAPPKTAGTSKFADAFPEAAVFFIRKTTGIGVDWRKTEELNCKHAHDCLVREWSTLAPAGTEPPDYSTCRRLLKRPQYLPRHIKELFAMGPKGYFATRGPSIQRERPDPGDWSVLDHREHDDHLLNDLFDEEDPAARFRVWKTLVLDWGSDFISGFCFSPISSSVTINSALRMAFVFGMPPNLCWDCGKDFKRMKRILEAEEGLNTVLKGRLEITPTIPYNAKGKPIEGLFGRVFAGRFDREWGAAYGGRNPQQRHEKNVLALAAHKKFLKGQVLRSPLPLASAFIANAVLCIQEHNDRPRDFLGGRTPRAVFTEAMAARPQLDQQTLDALFFLRDTRVIQRGGTVQLNGLTYQPRLEHQVSLSSWSMMSVTIARDPYDLREASAYNPQTGQFLGVLELQPMTPQSAHGQDPLSLAAIKDNAHRKTLLKRDAAKYAFAVTQLSAAHGWLSEPQYRALRAGGSRPLLAAAAPGAMRPVGRQAAISAPRVKPFACEVGEDDLAAFAAIEEEN